MLRWLCWWRPPSLLRRVTVNFRHSESEAIEGVLWQQRGMWFILRDCHALKAGHVPLKMDPHEVHIPRANVAYFQVAP